MTTFLNHFKVDKNLLEVDFFDPNLETDTRLYIDSYYLTRCENIHSKSALTTQQNFMKCLMEALKEKDEIKARKLCSIFLSPNILALVQLKKE